MVHCQFVMWDPVVILSYPQLMTLTFFLSSIVVLLCVSLWVCKSCVVLISGFCSLSPGSGSLGDQAETPSHKWCCVRHSLTPAGLMQWLQGPM